MEMSKFNFIDPVQLKDERSDWWSLRKKDGGPHYGHVFRNRVTGEYIFDPNRHCEKQVLSEIVTFMEWLDNKERIENAQPTDN